MTYLLLRFPYLDCPEERFLLEALKQLYQFDAIDRWVVMPVDHIQASYRSGFMWRFVSTYLSGVSAVGEVKWPSWGSWWWSSPCNQALPGLCSKALRSAVRTCCSPWPPCCLWRTFSSGQVSTVSVLKGVHKRVLVAEILNIFIEYRTKKALYN